MGLRDLDAPMTDDDDLGAGQGATLPRDTKPQTPLQQVARMLASAEGADKILGTVERIVASDPDERRRFAAAAELAKGAHGRSGLLKAVGHYLRILNEFPEGRAKVVATLTALLPEAPVPEAHPVEMNAPAL